MHRTANLLTNIVDFRGFGLKHNLDFKGWNSQAHKGLPGRFESSNVSRDNDSREIGRSPFRGGRRALIPRAHAGLRPGQLRDGDALRQGVPDIVVVVVVIII